MEKARGGGERTTGGPRAQEIIAASVELLVREGYGEFSLRKVAAGVGVRLGTVQYYFPTREALVAATLDRVLGGWSATLYEILSRRDRSPPERLYELQALSLELTLNTTATPFLLELFALAQREEFIRRRVRRRYLRYRIWIARLLREMRPDLEAKRLMIFATLLASQWEGLAFFNLPEDRQAADVPAVKNELDRALAAFLEMFRSAP